MPETYTLAWMGDGLASHSRVNIPGWAMPLLATSRPRSPVRLRPASANTAGPAAEGLPRADPLSQVGQRRRRREADLNHDGKMDLAAVVGVNESIVILLGNGDGTLQPAVTYSVGNSANAIVAGD